MTIQDTAPVQVDEATVIDDMTVVVVPPAEETPSEEPSEVETLRAQIALLAARVDDLDSRLSEDEVEEAPEEDIIHDEPPNDSGGEGAGIEREETPQEEEPRDRPIRRGLGGFLFTPFKDRRR